MGAIESLWQFIRGTSKYEDPLKYLSGKPSQVAKSSTGGAGAVKPPIIDTKFEDGIPKHMTHSIDDIPKLCHKTFKMVSRKKGATIDEVHAVVGNKKSSVYNHIYLIKKAGYGVVKTYEKSSGTHRYRLG